MPVFPITLAVITYNEADCIVRCLDSVPFADEKLVIDSGSTDNTVKIAESCGAKVIHQDWLGFGAQRNFASAQCSNDWIIVLDADEWLSDELIKELGGKLPDLIKSDNAAAILRRRSIYMGKPMRFYRPAVGEKLARIYHRDRAKWNDVSVHESLQFEGSAPVFTKQFNHANDPTLVHKQIKLLKYSELKCLDWQKKNKSTRLWQMPFIYPFAFIKDYIFRLAALDGWRGFAISQTAASYALYKRMRYFEMQKNPTSKELGTKQLKKHLIFL